MWLASLNKSPIQKLSSYAAPNSSKRSGELSGDTTVTALFSSAGAIPHYVQGILDIASALLWSLPG